MTYDAVPPYHQELIQSSLRGMRQNYENEITRITNALAVHLAEDPGGDILGQQLEASRPTLRAMHRDARHLRQALANRTIGPVLVGRLETWTWEFTSRERDER